MPGCCSLCQRVARAFTWLRTYSDRKEAKKAVNLSRYQHRRSAVVEVSLSFCYVEIDVFVCVEVCDFVYWDPVELCLIMLSKSCHL